MGQLRTLRLGLEFQLEIEIGTQWPIIEWLTEHSCTTINRAQVGHDGKTPFRSLLGKDSPQPMVEFGEQFFCKNTAAEKDDQKDLISDQVDTRRLDRAGGEIR